jgi:hypothetical protein
MTCIGIAQKGTCDLEQENRPADILFGGRSRHTARNCANHNKRFLTGHDGEGERLVGRVVGEVFFTGEEAQKGTALDGDVVADGSAQHGIAGFERIEHRKRWVMGRFDFEHDLTTGVRRDTEVEEVRTRIKSSCMETFRVQEMTLREEAFARAEGHCECTLKGCGHAGRCLAVLRGEWEIPHDNAKRLRSYHRLQESLSSRKG